MGSFGVCVTGTGPGHHHLQAYLELVDTVYQMSLLGKEFCDTNSIDLLCVKYHGYKKATERSQVLLGPWSYFIV